MILSYQLPLNIPTSFLTMSLFPLDTGHFSRRWGQGCCAEPQEPGRHAGDAQNEERERMVFMVISDSLEEPKVNWEFQDPKMEVLYFIRPYVLLIFSNSLKNPKVYRVSNRVYAWEKHAVNICGPRQLGCFVFLCVALPPGTTLRYLAAFGSSDAPWCRLTLRSHEHSNNCSA